MLSPEDAAIHFEAQIQPICFCGHTHDPMVWQSNGPHQLSIRHGEGRIKLPETGKIGDLANFSDPVVLMRAPYRAFFSYAGPDHVWQNIWRDIGQLPIAIRILVRDATTQRTLAVSTATILRISASAECARARIVKDCIYPPVNAPPAASSNRNK